MKIRHEYWTIDEISKKTKEIDFPEFQREPTVWRLDKKQRLIDSILRDFDISSIYLYEKEEGGFDCIDGRQRINSIWSYLGINGEDNDDNGFNLLIDNEIYNDKGKYTDANYKRFNNLSEEWKKMILDYSLNIVIIEKIEEDEELNLLFLRLQIASVLNAGEKLNAMTGNMRDWIFHKTKNTEFFKKLNIPKRRFAKEQVAAQIAINVFSKRRENLFHRSRYVDLQDFFKQYARFTDKDKIIVSEIKNRFSLINDNFNEKLSYIKNRALAVSLYLYIDSLLEQKREDDISTFVTFFEKFLKTLKWQIPKGIEIANEYQELLQFQTNISQAAGEKRAIERRHDFINDYFAYYLENDSMIKGDKGYKDETGTEPDDERNKVSL